MKPTAARSLPLSSEVAPNLLSITPFFIVAEELSLVDDGLWGFEVTDADRYVIAFFRLQNE